MSEQQASGKTVQITEVIFELQKRKSLFHSYEAPEFVDFKMNPKSLDSVTLESGWQWLTEWHNDGADAWMFGTHWSSKFVYAENFWDTFKRKKWYRLRMKPNVEESELTELKKRYASSQIKILQPTTTIYKQLSAYQQKLKQNLATASSKTTKPNILLLGASGAGKSSLVNAVFGKPLAEIGEGKPITQHYTKFSGQNSPVVIYDSKGIENGNAGNNFVRDTKKFFKKLKQQDVGVEAHIHAVWYVIDLTQARFQPFEAEFCRNSLRGIPIIFVFNKADAVTSIVRKTMIETVNNFHLPNCHGLFPTVANCKNFDRKDCPHCGSLKIRKKLKEGTCTILCKECSKTELMTKQMGIEELSRATLSVLPDLVKQVFVHSVQSETLEREVDAKQIITHFADDASLTKSDLLLHLQELTKKLITNYDMNMLIEAALREVTHRYSMYYVEQSFRRKAHMFVNDLFSKKSHTLGESLVVATGLEVCSAVIRFAKQAIEIATIEDDNHTASDASIPPHDNPSMISAAPLVQQTCASTPPVSISTPLVSISAAPLVQQTCAPLVQDQNETNSTLATVGVVQRGDLGNRRVTPEERQIMIEKLIANFSLTHLDGELVNRVANELRRHGSTARYLAKIAIDGECNYFTPEELPVAEILEEDNFVLISYQDKETYKKHDSSSVLPSGSAEGAAKQETGSDNPPPVPSTENNNAPTSGNNNKDPALIVEEVKQPEHSNELNNK